MRLKDTENNTLSPERLEQLFLIGKTADGKPFFNLTETVHIPDEIPPEYLGVYQVKGKMSWHNISYDIYGTVNLWWLILAVNRNLSPIKLPESGTNVYFIRKDIAAQIVNQINNA